MRWCTKKDEELFPIFFVVQENTFKAKWNFQYAGYIFAIDPNSFDEVGCIHTTQGLEFDYAVVIIGMDLLYRNGSVITDKTKNASTDKSSGIRYTKDISLADKLIRNTYKALLTRGQEGCFIYCEDEALQDYFKQYMTFIPQRKSNNELPF